MNTYKIMNFVNNATMTKQPICTIGPEELVKDYAKHGYGRLYVLGAMTIYMLTLNGLENMAG